WSSGSAGPSGASRGPTIGCPANPVGPSSSAIGLSGLGAAIGDGGKIMGGPTGWLIAGGASAAGVAGVLAGGVSIGTVSKVESGVAWVTGSAAGVCVTPTVTGSGASATLGGAASGDSVELAFPESRPVVVGGSAGGVAGASVLVGAGVLSTGAGEVS